jgi:hypothetical protein
VILHNKISSLTKLLNFFIIIIIIIIIIFYN